MAVIEVSHLSKDYYISKKEKGLKGALHNLVKNEKNDDSCGSGFEF